MTHPAYFTERLSEASWLAPDGERLAPLLLAHGVIHRLDAGAWVHGERDDTSGLLIVFSGAIDLYCHGLGERQVRIGHLSEGGAIGQSAHLGGGPRLVTAVCAQASELLLVPDAALVRISKAVPEIWRAVARLLYGQLRRTLQNTADLLTLPPQRLVASRLVELARSNGAATIPLSQAALAEMVGLTRKSVNLALRDLAARGVVTIAYRAVSVVDIDRLMNFVRDE